MTKNSNNFNIGSKLKAIRKKYGYTLEELSKKCNLSKTYISQIENNIQTNPSIGTLKKIFDVFNIPILHLFNTDEDHVNEDKIIIEKKHITKKDKPDIDKNVFVVRKNNRKIMRYASADWTIELLSPDLKRKMEFILTTASPGKTSGPETLKHEGEECGLILEGSIVFTIEGKDYLLNEGDSIYFNSNLEHSWSVIGDKTVKKIWVITPPSF